MFGGTLYETITTNKTRFEAHNGNFSINLFDDDPYVFVYSGLHAHIVIQREDIPALMAALDVFAYDYDR